MKKEKIFDISKDEVFCYDCALSDIKTPIEIKDDNIINGVQIMFDFHGEKHCVFKCKECFEKNGSVIKDLQECEVYSRIVGYIRPVQQWHEGKKSEWNDRVNFNIDKYEKNQKTQNIKK